MFGVAKLVIQNKVVVIGLIVAGGFFFMGNQEKPKPSSPWASGAVASAPTSSSDKGSMTSKMMGVVSSASKYAGVDKVLPHDLAKQTVNNFGTTEKSFKEANHRSE